MGLFFKYPDAVDPEKVGTYDLETFSGAGFFYDEVLEYRVWVKKPGERAPMCHMFATYKDAFRFSVGTKHAEPPLVLILQRESINEPTSGVYVHVKKPRITEWFPWWLKGKRGTKEQIPKFLAKKNKKSKLSLLKGTKKL